MNEDKKFDEKDENMETKGKDELTLAIENNACSVCRSMGLPPPCLGHKGGGGGGGSGGGGSKNSSDTPTMVAEAKNTNSKTDENQWESTFGTEYWSELNWLDDAISFDKPEALVKIQIEFADCILTIDGKNELSPTDLKALHEFFDVIKSEFNQFKDELAAKNINVDKFKIDVMEKSLTIVIPDKQLFAAFIERLVDKNLLPTKSLLQREFKVDATHDQKDEQDKKEEKAFNPNPFKMENKPDGIP